MVFSLPNNPQVDATAARPDRQWRVLDESRNGRPKGFTLFERGLTHLLLPAVVPEAIPGKLHPGQRRAFLLLARLRR